MSEEVSRAMVDRRNLIRGGAVLAGALGATAVGAAMGPTTAVAADGDALLLGRVNVAASGTTVQMNGDPTAAAVRVEKVQGGPQLSLEPTDLTSELAVGDVQNTPDGPYVGVSDGAGGATTTYLATGYDLDQLPVPVARPPARYLDTRSSAWRARVVRTSPSPYDPSGRLKGGSWLDVQVGNTTADPVIDAVFLNATVTQPASLGYLTLYPPGTRPGSSSLNFNAGQTIANGAFVATGLFGSYYTIRVYAAATTHVIIDVTGLTVLGPTAVPAAQQAAKAKKTDGRSAARRIRRAASKGTR